MDVSSSKMVSLNGMNYHSWKGKMQDLLFVKSMHLPVFGSGKPESKSDEEWKFEHQQVCGFIRMWVDDNVRNLVANETDAKKLWVALESMYASKTGNNKLYLLKQLINLKYVEGTPISNHVNEFQGLLDQLSNVGVTFEDEILGLWLLNTLPDSWETFRVSHTNSAPDNVMSFDYAKSGILNEEIRKRTQGTSSHTEVLFTEQRGRQQHKGQGNRGKSRSKSRGKYKNIECYYCKKPGHVKKDCYKLKNKNGAVSSKSENSEESTSGRVATATSADLVVVYDDCDVNLISSDSSWVGDSGAAVHVTSRREFFSTYIAGDFGHLRMGNNDLTKVVGIGNIHLKMDNGSTVLLRDVKHAPSVRLNLISIGKLDDDGYGNNFVDGKWKISKGSLVLAKGTKLKENLYLLQASILVDSVNVVKKQCSPELWHKRLSHISAKGLDVLVKKNILQGAKSSIFDKCSHCLEGKQTRVSFKTNPPHRQPNVLDLVHSDVCGPLKVKTLGGASYFVTFIDDHSRKLWVYALKTKDQVLEKFKEFQALVERQTGRKLKCIRTDNGGEYRGPFEEYCRQQGIRHQKTPPKTPQLNGLAERMNRTLMERVRCMLLESKLPQSFWGEALYIASYIINLTPTVALQDDVPENVWTGKNTSYDHLRVFGCRASVHVPRDERSKLDAKARQCIFIGYGQDEFGYKLYDPIEKKVIRSRDVVFFEDQTIEDIEKAEKSYSHSQDDSIDVDPVPTTVGGDTIETELQHDDFADGQQGENLHNPTDDDSEEVQLRRSTRERQESTRYPRNEYVLVTDGGEPECFEEAVECVDKLEWLHAMEDEIKSLHDNHTFELVPLPKGKRALKNRWVYRLKQEEKSLKPRYKARLVVKGFSQKKGVDFDEIFSPVVRMSSIRTVLGLAANLDLKIEQMDVKTAFLHGDLNEEIYMEQPEGFKVKGKEDYVCKLSKSLYGLKQAPRQWYKKFEHVMRQHGYKKTTCDHCVFVQKFSHDDFIILLLYVDDMLIVGQNASRIDRLKQELSKSFDMKDLGPARKILGISISRDRKARKLWLSQEKYIEKVLERFRMENAKSVSTPLATHMKLSVKQSPSTDKEKEEMKNVPYSSAVGSLMYAMVCTRPDIAHAVGVVSRFLSKPGREHWNAVKWILRYLRGTSGLKLCFGGGESVLTGYTDSDMAGDIDTFRSTSGYLTTFAGGAVSWQSRLQKCVALSTTEAEFIAVTEACKELLYLKRFLKELGCSQKRYVLLCDSQSAIHLGKHPTFHSKSKHIDVRYHWIRDVLDEKLIELEKVHTDDNGADMMTKALPRCKFEVCCGIAGMAISST